MSDYIHLFETQAAHDAVYNGSGYQEPWTALVTANNKVSYNKEPLTFKILSGGTIGLHETDDLGGFSIQYSINNGTWTEALASGTNFNITVSAGDIVKFKGVPNKFQPLAFDWEDDGWSARRYFTNSENCKFEISGNLLSLYYPDDFMNPQQELTWEDGYAYPFPYLFSEECTGLISAKNLILGYFESDFGGYYRGYTHLFAWCPNLKYPPKTLGAAEGTVVCGNMFESCTNLITTPKFTKASLNIAECFQNMFAGCTSLTSAPELPATTLSEACYRGMFYDCTSLTTAPELPATTLTAGCYSGMFQNCTNLIIPPVLSVTTLARGCYHSMFEGCTSLTTAPTLPATTLAENCYTSMFRGCTSLVNAPVLPAATLTSMCYYSMFESCNNLSSITCLATNISAYLCVNDWLKRVSSTGTFTKAASMTSWPSGTSGIPSNWTVQDAS